MGSPDVDQKPLFTNGSLRIVWQPRPEPYDPAKGLMLWPSDKPAAATAARHSASVSGDTHGTGAGVG